MGYSSYRTGGRHGERVNHVSRSLFDAQKFALQFRDEHFTDISPFTQEKKSGYQTKGGFSN